MTAAEKIAIVQASVAGLLTIITIFYVVLTGRLAKSAAEQAKAATEQAKTAAEQLEAQTRPYVWIDLRIEPSGMIWLRIRNAGITAAENLRLTPEREIRTVNDVALNGLPMFATALPQLPPGVERTYMLGSHVHLKDFQDLRIEASYQRGSQSYLDSQLVSVAGFMGTILPPKGETAKEIELLRKAVEKLGKSVAKIADKPEPLPPLGPW